MSMFLFSKEDKVALREYLDKSRGAALVELEKNAPKLFDPNKRDNYTIEETAILAARKEGWLECIAKLRDLASDKESAGVEARGYTDTSLD